jgi:hypothetical protein
VQLAQQARRLLHHRNDVHGDDLVEARIGKTHCLGVHLVQPLDVGQLAPSHAHAGLLQHLARQIDPSHTDVRRIQRQRQSRADAHFEHALAGSAFERAHHRLSAGLQHRAEQRVVDIRVPPVGGFHGFDLHGLLFIAIRGPGTTLALFIPVPA